MLTRLGNYKEAEAAAQWMLDLRMAKRTQPDIRALPGCGRHSETRKGDESATMAFQRVPTADPALRVAILAEAGRLRWLSGNVREGEQTLNEALKLNPDYAPALETLGNVRLAQQKYREAIELLQDAVIKSSRRRACCSRLPKPQESW